MQNSLKHLYILIQMRHCEKFAHYWQTIGINVHKLQPRGEKATTASGTGPWTMASTLEGAEFK